MRVSDCGIQKDKRQFNPQSKIGIPQCMKTRRRGQGAQCPDRFITKKRLICRSSFSE